MLNVFYNNNDNNNYFSSIEYEPTKVNKRWINMHNRNTINNFDINMI